MAQSNPLNSLKRKSNLGLFDEISPSAFRERHPSLIKDVENSPLPFSIGSDLSLFIAAPNLDPGRLMLQMALAASLSGQKVLFVSLKRSIDQVKQSVLSLANDTKPINNEQSDKLTLQEKANRLMINGKIGSLTIVNNYDDTGQVKAIDAKQISQWIDELSIPKHNEAPIDLVFIDHIGIMVPNQITAGQFYEGKIVVSELYNVARTTNVSIKIAKHLPLHILLGVSFPHEKDIAYYDYIYRIWRPEDSMQLTPYGKSLYRGKLEIALSKHKHGLSGKYEAVPNKSGIRIQINL